MKSTLSQKTYRVRSSVFHWFVGLSDANMFALVILVNLGVFVVQVISLCPLLMGLTISANAWWPVVPAMDFWQALQMSFWLTLISRSLSWSRRALTPSPQTPEK